MYSWTGRWAKGCHKRSTGKAGVRFEDDGRGISCTSMSVPAGSQPHGGRGRGTPLLSKSRADGLNGSYLEPPNR